MIFIQGMTLLVVIIFELVILHIPAMPTFFTTAKCERTIGSVCALLANCACHHARLAFICRKRCWLLCSRIHRCSSCWCLSGWIHRCCSCGYTSGRIQRCCSCWCHSGGLLGAAALARAHAGFVDCEVVYWTQVNASIKRTTRTQHGRCSCGFLGRTCWFLSWIHRGDCWLISWIHGIDRAPAVARTHTVLVK